MSEAANRRYAIKNRRGDYVALLRSREEAETFEGGLWDGDTIEELVHSTALLTERKETIERCAAEVEARVAPGRMLGIHLAAAIRSLGRE